MRIEPLGDLAWILRDLPAKPASVAEAIERAAIPEITDVVPCAETVGVYGSQAFDTDSLLQVVESAVRIEPDSELHQIPVCYDLGEDLDYVATLLGLDRDEVTHQHCLTEVECFAIGFCPGFAYLGPVSEALRGVPRLTSPRTRTEPGSVGLTGRQTGVYPLPRPGGWPIIGRTPLTLVDERDGYFPIKVGDRIRFQSITQREYGQSLGRRL